MKYVLVSGGVISGIGKGIIASSTALLLQTLGLTVSMIKIDPYMNIDAGTMSPLEHGEVFVLSDGGETDLDLRNYERNLNIELSKDHNITTGKVYLHVVERERRGDYLGKTVQVVPHLTDAVGEWIERVAKIPVDEEGRVPDVCFVELGGTAGDIENGPFIEALRQFRRKLGKGGFLHIHVSMIPVINGEQKTKPTQQAIRDIRSTGLRPDLIACRCKDPLLPSTIEKVSMFCQLDTEQILAVHDVPSVYLVPQLLESQNLLSSLSSILNFSGLHNFPERSRKGASIWKSWKESTDQQNLEKKVKIVLVGKYTSFADAYISVIKALEHCAMAISHKLNLIMVDASHLEDSTKKDEFEKAWDLVRTADGILVPGGFGIRGTEGMIAATKYAREHKVPFLGVCLGMQVAVIEYARNMCELEGAGSVELDAKTTHPVIIYMPEIDRSNLGGTMRLGIRPTHFQPGSDEWSKIHSLYSNSSSSSSSSNTTLIVKERHRHRYEVNPSYIPKLEKNGLVFVGKDEKGERMEILELGDHPWFVGVQFHPEYLSRVLKPSRPFLGFLAASAGCLDLVMGGKVGDVGVESFGEVLEKVCI